MIIFEDFITRTRWCSRILIWIYDFEKMTVLDILALVVTRVTPTMTGPDLHTGPFWSIGAEMLGFVEHGTNFHSSVGIFFPF